MVTSTYLETRTKYANGVIPGRLAVCPAGYTNIGIAGCGKGFKTESLGSGSCSKGYFKGAAGRCYKTCKSGYTNMGEFCARGVSMRGPSSFICKSSERRGGGLIANKRFPTKQASATSPRSARAPWRRP